jgi:plastocyanin
VLGGAFFIVSQERMARAALSLLSPVALVAVVAAGAVGLAYWERHFEKKGGVTVPVATASASIATVDSNLAFSTSTLQFPAQQTVALTFDNQGAGIPHDVAIYDHQGGKELFQGKIITGPAKVVYDVTPLAAGTYYFQCDVHPSMNGTVVVAPSGAGSSSAAGPASAPTTAAPATTSTTAPVSAGFATTATTAAVSSPATTAPAP